VPLEQFAIPGEPASKMRLAVLGCLCGMPVRPNIGGVRGGTAQQEIREFMDNFQSTTAQLPTHADVARLVGKIQSTLIEKEKVREVLAALAEAERQIARCLRWAEGKAAQPGRLWRLPKRPPATRGRDQMVVALQQRGFKFRKARWLVRQFWKLIAELIRKGEVVEMPIGTLRAAESPKRQVRLRFGKTSGSVRQAAADPLPAA
jgi:hypothetical protein